MDHKLGPVGVASGKVQPAAMAADQLGRDGQAKARPTLSRPALKGRKQVLTCFWRQAGASVADLDPPFALVLSGRDLDRTGLPRCVDRLTGVAHQVRQHAIKLFAIRPDRQAGLHVNQDRDKGVAGQPFAFGNLEDQLGKVQPEQLRRRFLGLAERQGRLRTG